MIESEAWGTSKIVKLPVTNDITLKFTFNVISSCTFNLRFAWSEAPAMFDQGMSMHECFRIVLNNLPLRTLAPSWAYSLPIPLLRHVDMGYAQLLGYLKSQITLQREQVNNEGGNLAGGHDANALFNKILRANIDGGKFAFDEGKVVGNTFISLTAGHASAAVLVQEAIQDIHLSITNKMTREKECDVVLKKGTVAVVDVVGMHYNPRHFPSPEAFKPSHWEANTTSELNVFVGFGQVMLLRNWKVKVDLKEGETPDQWRRKNLTVSAN
ncbi:hypothetical protein BOTBODRAFT_178823 [Botryobasidium botryosum FD-172 SS1]|uniref:Uncharacterized protein n=1 Tax=Botryobasidium botryosum (strain FD-172 SS1) TaxID=930990 RepID=A0A067M1E3_BOTB1|nr:hypothetical protein BOTBODRAFT_178823 [Botryobasidium botryosum FD-172 SS1]